jgi:hypothetical protein
MKTFNEFLNESNTSKMYAKGFEKLFDKRGDRTVVVTKPEGVLLSLVDTDIKLYFSDNDGNVSITQGSSVKGVFPAGKEKKILTKVDSLK